MRVATSLAFIGILILAACSNTEQDPPPIEQSLQANLAAWLDAEGETPERYVVGLFSDHDVVFLGEQHRVKHDVLLVQSLISPLYEAGLHVLATEFGRREDQAQIDSLLAAPEWDEQQAREIVFRHSVFWGYQEYIDVYRSAWELNRRLPEGVPRFRILGINDSPDWSLIRTKSDRDDSAIMREVWGGTSEEDWAAVILNAVRSGEKVLVHCGIHHAFTEYRQPIVIDGKFSHFDHSLRCGNHVFAALDKRAVTVFLHAPWSGQQGYGSPLRHPAGGVIDAFMLADGPRPVGFDLAEGPFGEIRVEDAIYRHGYQEFKLADFCDGWIYTKPISEYEGVTPVPGWVNESNLAHARAQSPNPSFRQASTERFNRSIARAAEIRGRWGHLRWSGSESGGTRTRFVGSISGMAQTAGEHQGIEVSEPVPYARVYADSEGETHFSDETLSFQLVDYAPPAPPISVSEVFGAESVGFISSPAGWHGDWHPAPRRQFILVLAGELEVEVSDSEVRHFGPGSLCLVEDTAGKGHVSRVVSPERVLAAAIPLAGE